MKTSVTTLLILLSVASFGQQTLPPAPQDPVDLHLPDSGAKMRSSAILPAAVLGGFAFVASKAEPSQVPAQVLASLAVVGTTTLYLAGDYRKRRARRPHQ
jgi:hypothetical protein